MEKEPAETQTKIVVKTMNEKPSHYHLSNSDRLGDLVVSHPL